MVICKISANKNQLPCCKIVADKLMSDALLINCYINTYRYIHSCILKYCIAPISLAVMEDQFSISRVVHCDRIDYVNVAAICIHINFVVFGNYIALNDSECSSNNTKGITDITLT